MPAHTESSRTPVPRTARPERRVARAPLDEARPPKTEEPTRRGAVRWGTVGPLVGAACGAAMLAVGLPAVVTGGSVATAIPGIMFMGLGAIILGTVISEITSPSERPSDPNGDRT